MANLISRCQGFRKSGSPRNKESTRLGDGSVRAEAATWRTFASVAMSADGSGYATIYRDGKMMHSHTWGKE